MGNKYEGLIFAKLNALDLCVGRCPNGHIHIFGFHHQLHGEIDVESMTMTTTANCKECGCEVKRVDKLAWSKHSFSEGAGI